MLYELIAVVRTGNARYVKDIAHSTSTLLLSRNATIRNLTNWGVFDLPRPTIKHQTTHYKGHYFVLTFDSSSAAQAEVRRQLGLNPHMIRFSVVKLGVRLGGMRNQRGRIEELPPGADAQWVATMPPPKDADGEGEGAEGDAGLFEGIREHRPMEVE